MPVRRPLGPTSLLSHRRHSRCRAAPWATACAAVLLTGTLSVPSAAAGPAEGATTSAGPGAWATPAGLGFHDVTADGSPRPVRDDLVGAFRGQVELAQSHTIAASGNAAREMPRLVARREALLLLTPQVPTSNIWVTATRGAETLGTMVMSHPNALPRADQSLSRESVAYSRRAWSAQLPWHWLTPGLTLTFADAGGATGTLPAAAIDMGPPTEMVINSIRLGMLTDPPQSGGQRLLDQPARGGADYFQTVPVSRMVVAKYDDVRLDKVIVRSGAIYETPGTSATTGDVYSGDMRENVAKAQVSTGINLANFGISSAQMDQSQPGTFNQRIIHHAAGAYTNGRQSHGLSGGNGMATLYDSVGNELSHELGHSYGLGHYPGTNTNAVGDARIINATHHADSGWGWISYRNRMRSNLDPGRYDAGGRWINDQLFAQTFAGKYNYLVDAMSGGWDASELSDYTHHTGYSARRIQNSLATVAPDASYPSGYRAWDSATGQYIDAKVARPNFAAAAPVRAGVPVFTLLGGYNPAVPAQTVLYPAFRSNYGNTFNQPAPDLTSTARQCWVEVEHLGGRVDRISLLATDGVKQLNINVAQADRPTKAVVRCSSNGTTTQLGDVIDIPTDLAPMAPAVVLGQEAGFKALRDVELKALEPTLVAMSGRATPVPTAADLMVLDSWSDDISLLGPVAKRVAERILAQRASVGQVADFLHQHADDLRSGTRATRVQLIRLINQHGLGSGDGRVLPSSSQVRVDGTRCLTLDSSTRDPEAWVAPNGAACPDTEEFRWFADARGALHNQASPDLCLAAGSPVAMQQCSTDAEGQEWLLQDDGHVVRRSSPDSALDLNRSTSRPGVWSRTGGSNQLWNRFRPSDDALLVWLDPVSLADLFTLGLDDLVDTLAPTVSLSADPAIAASAWYAGQVRVSVFADDDFGATPGLEIALADGVWTTYTSPIMLPEGATAVWARATDRSGNRSVPVVGTFLSDRTAPTASATLDPQERLVTLNGQDTLSGVARLEHRTESGEWRTYRTPLVMGPESTRLTYRAVDSAGNVGVAQVLDVAAASVSVPPALAPPGAVAKSRPVARVRIRSPKHVRRGDPFVVRVAVSAVDVAVRGRLRVRISPAGSRQRLYETTQPLRAMHRAGRRRAPAVSRATVRLPTRIQLAPGRYRITVVFQGSADVAKGRRLRGLRVT